MDPLAALSVAGTIVQFVDYGTKLLSGCVGLYQSATGLLKTHEELELITADLRSVVFKLRSVSSMARLEPSTANDNGVQASFYKICDKATGVAEQLVQKLEGLRRKDGKHRVWESLKAALKVALSTEEVKSLKQRLSTLQSSLQSGTLLVLVQKMNDQSTYLSTRFDSLDEKTQKILTALSNTPGIAPEEITRAIAKMVCRVEKGFQDEHRQTREMILAMTSKKDRHKDRATVETITAEVEMLHVGSDEEERLRSLVNKQVLEELPYPHMTNRYEDILESHPTTFDWIFSSAESSGVPWSDFGRWLREDGDIYWINGKPGSGKSTLMKHIYDAPKTVKLLQKWMQRDLSIPCCTATFFFWNSGTSMQKGQQGLLRSLLYQVLSEHQKLVPIVFPNRWAEIYSANLGAQYVSTKLWSLRQLEDALERLTTQKQYPLKVCYFIDGLDEFIGDAEKLCRLFQRLCGNSNRAKICVSSRPWVQFQQSFEGCASLRLQDLTAGDIATFVNDSLKQNAAFMRLAAQDQSLTSALRCEIMEKAEGVFLWVDVVVRLLLRGINNRDTVEELWQRLESFPRDLYPLYDKILTQIEPIYLNWASRAFQLMQVATELSSDPFKRRSKSSTKLNPFRRGDEASGVNPLTLIEFLYGFLEVYDLSDPEKVSAILTDFPIHLTARCAGLLEVSNFRPVDEIDLEDPDSNAFQRVRWMHRTARDFMSEDAKWMKIFADKTPPGFSAPLSLMRASVMSLSAYPTPETMEITQRSLHYRGLTTNAWIFAYHTNGHAGTREERTALLYTLMNMRDSPQFVQVFPVTNFAFLSQATMYCLSEFVEDYLSKESKAREYKAHQKKRRILPTDWEPTEKETARTLMARLCDQVLIASSYELPFPTTAMVEVLLDFGRFPPRHVDTSEEDVEPSLPILASNAHGIHPLEISCFLQSQISIMEIFLKAGVDPTKTLGYIGGDFILDKVLLQQRVEERLPRDCEDAGLVLETLEYVIKDEVRFQQGGSKGGGGKRKLIEIIADDNTASDQSDGDDVIYLGERPVKRDKRVEFHEDY